MQRRPFLQLLGGVFIAIDALAVSNTGPIHYYADLSADEEPTPTESPGSGRADFSLDRSTLLLSWSLSFKGTTSPVTGIHIHGPQRVGANAGVQIDLGAKTLRSPLKGSIVLNDSQVEALVMRRMYVNITTSKYPKGELRGQIQRMRSQ